MESLALCHRSLNSALFNFFQMPTSSNQQSDAVPGRMSRKSLDNRGIRFAGDANGTAFEKLYFGVIVAGVFVYAIGKGMQWLSGVDDDRLQRMESRVDGMQRELRELRDIVNR